MCCVNSRERAHSETLRPGVQRKPEAGVGRGDGVAAENRVKCETRGLCTKATAWPNNAGSAKNTQKVNSIKSEEVKTRRLWRCSKNISETVYNRWLESTILDLLLQQPLNISSVTTISCSYVKRYNENQRVQERCCYIRVEYTFTGNANLVM